ncbi:histone-lysine N-methyltransferase SETMAR [Trichonephila clavipes]|nr:histone-lysine N-methyltransferase SETMAR [Trichonephila clavipes]
MSFNNLSKKKPRLCIGNKRLLLSGHFVGWSQQYFLCGTDILSKLKGVIRKKLHRLLKYGILLMDENARSHSATAMQNHIKTLGLRTYITVLISYQETHVFPGLKKNFTLRCFGCDAEVKQAVKRFFRMQSPEFSLEVFLKLIK